MKSLRAPSTLPATPGNSRMSPAILPHPRCTLLSNGSYSLLLSDLGHSRANCSQVRIYRCDERSQGLVVCVYYDGKLFPLTPLPFNNPEFNYSSIFEPSCVIYTAEGNGISARMTVRVSVADNCETREIFVSGIQVMLNW